MDENERRVGLA